MRRRTSADLMSGPILRWLIVVGAPLALGLLLLAKSFAILTDPSAMDIAQLARNLAGSGHFHTDVIRPFSLLFHASVKDHPDLYNEPLQPLLLSLVFRIAGATDRSVGVTGVLLWLTTVWLTLAFARRLFSWRVAGLAALLIACNGAVSGVALSGRGTVLASVLLLLILWALYRPDPAAGGDEQPITSLPLSRLAIVGALLGLATLADYKLIAVALPLTIFAVLDQRKVGWWRGLLVVVIAMAVLLPWCVHNQVVAGTPFPALRVYDLAIGTPTFPGDSLMRSIDPAEAESARPLNFIWKHLGDLVLKGRSAVGALQGAITRSLGSIVAFFFLVSAFSPLGNPRLVGLRRCYYGMFFAYFVVAALTRFRSDDVVAFVPFATILAAYGVRQLIGSIDFSALRRAFQVRDWRVGAVPVWRTVVSVLFIFLALWPFKEWLTTPSYAHVIAGMKPFGYLKPAPGEPVPLVMSDVPEDIAWYCDRPAVWLTHTARGFDRLQAQVEPVGILVMVGQYFETRGWMRMTGQQGTWWGIAYNSPGPYKGLVLHGRLSRNPFERVRALPGIKLPKPLAEEAPTARGEA